MGRPSRKAGGKLLRQIVAYPANEFTVGYVVARSVADEGVVVFGLDQTHVSLILGTIHSRPAGNPRRDRAKPG
jgi:hypothetical protein